MARRLNLALQGGGAHGAFAWGVLDRLLEDETIEIAAISGTSAGALNGAALKAGLALGGAKGRQAARDNLNYIWAEVGEASDNLFVRWLNSMLPMPRKWQRLAEMFSPMAWFDNVSRMFSPYDTGPFYTNPLGPIIRGMPHPDCRAANGPELFVTATNVRTGRIRVFQGDEVTPEAVMASACLPSIFRAVEIHDRQTGRKEAFWDGGYSGNPALFPLYDQKLPRDILIVAINPLVRHALPRSPVAIQERITEVSFNASLLSELRAINFVKRLHAENRLEGRVMKNVLIHLINDDRLMNSLGASTKLMPGPGLLEKMRLAGRQAAEHFVDQHLDKIGKTDSYDVSALFSTEPG